MASQQLSWQIALIHWAYEKPSKRQRLCHLETSDPSILILHLHVMRRIFILA